MGNWIGAPPSNCDICSKAIVSCFVDGKTKMGPWGNMCISCHKKMGVGLGTGKGQKYEKQPDNSWKKIEG